MTIPVSLVLLLGTAVFLAWRCAGMRVWHAVICMLFGFYLAQTTAAPEVRHLVSSLINVLTSPQR